MSKETIKKAYTSKEDVDFSKTEYGKVLLGCSFLFCQNVADAWISFADAVTENYSDFMKKTKQDLENAKKHRKKLLRQKTEILESVNDSCYKCIKTRKNYCDVLNINNRIVRDYHAYLQAVKNHNQVLQEKYYDSFVQHQKWNSAKKKAWKIHEKAQINRDKEKQRYSQFMENHSRETERLVTVISHRQWNYEHIKEYVIDKIRNDKEHIYQVLKTEEHVSTTARRIKGIINKFSRGNFDIVLTDDEKEECINLIMQYMMQSDLCSNINFLKVLYNKQEESQETEFKFLDRYTDKEITYKVFNAFATTFLGFVRMSYTQVFANHYRKESLDAKRDNGEDEEMDGYEHTSNEDNNDNNWLIGNYKKNRQTKLNPRKIYDESTQDVWQESKTFLLSKTDEMASSVIQMIQNPMWDNQELSDILKCIIRKIDTTLFYDGWVGSKLKHIIKDAFQGFGSKLSQEQITDAVNTCIQLYLCNYYIEKLCITERLEDADDYSKKLYNYVMNKLEKNKEKYEKCCKEANLEKKINFLTEEVPDTPPTSKTNTICLKKI